MDATQAHEWVESSIRRGNHFEVYRLLRDTLADDAEFRDGIANRYLQMSERSFQRPYEHVLHAASLCALGLTDATRARILEAFVRVGFRHRAEQAARELGRPLSVDHVRTLVKVYTDGCVLSEREERELLRLAWDTGGALLGEWTTAQLAAMHQRWTHKR